MDEAQAQAVRLRRLGMAAASYAFTLGMGVGCVAAGLLPWRIFAVYAAGVVIANLSFYALIRSGWSRRLADPSLTAPQILGAMLLHMVPMSHGGVVRGPLLILAAVPFLYGLFRLSRARLLALGTLYVVGYLLFLGVLHARGQALEPGVEALRTLALAVVLSQIAFVGGYLTRLRERLRERNEALREALARIAEIATRDELTGLPNRRALLETLERAVHRSARGARPVVVAMLDLDRFKRVNDGLGHAAGDEVLRRVAAAVDAELRGGDSFGRLGGEEFVAVLTETDALGAAGTAERLRRVVEGLELGDVEPGLRVTASIGLAAWRAGDDTSALLERADRALYAAKDAGRNRVAWSEAPEAAAATA